MTYWTNKTFTKVMTHEFTHATVDIRSFWFSYRLNLCK